VVGSIDVNQIASHNLTNKYTHNDYNLLVSFMDRFREIVVTPNILTEASNLLETYSYKGQQALTVLQNIARIMTEILSESLATMDKYPKSYLKFGLSDSVIHYLAEQGCIVLTDDLNLCYYLQGHSLLAFNFNHLRTDSLLH
jgi:predicted nucleic acid-binding protein